ncbi:MAG: alpha/beta hydrolase [Alphaproteobacteria bacterium]|nr:alpha/beta hydrolase [Alphaproteobacteria bacterium]
MAWILTCIAVSIDAALLVFAFAVLWVGAPVAFDTVLGLAGAVLLFFPLHLLVVTILAGAFAAVAKARHARLALVASVVGAMVSAILAVAPAVATWRYAQRHGVDVSLGDYLANASHMNLGPPQPARSVVYWTAPGGDQLSLDVWPAANDAARTPHPALLRLHGGAFVGGNRSDMPDWDRWFNQLGYTVFDADYRLSPPPRWQEVTGDVKCALGWVAAHAAAYDIDPSRISITGFSAGANLAMLAAYSAGDPRLPSSCGGVVPKLRSVINLYGNTDSIAIYDTSASLTLVRDAAQQYVGGSPTEYRERHITASPVTYVGAASPPTLSFLGTSDRIIPTDQLTRLDQALRAAGVVSDAYLIPATDHGFDVNWGGFATQFARAKIATFLQQHG